MAYTPDLPMELWSRVAVYLSFYERLTTFHALRLAGCLPDTRTNVPNAFMQFCSDADRIERERPEENVNFDEMVNVLSSLGFVDHSARLALRLSNWDMGDAVEYLISK